MLYHASPVPDIHELEPRISNHGVPLVYTSSKRENSLVYLSNAVEKFCRETGFMYEGRCPKWASYGFRDGILELSEYYPNALTETYGGVSGYIYVVNKTASSKEQRDIPFAFSSSEPLPVISSEFVADALCALRDAASEGKLILCRYEELSERMRRWIAETIRQEYADANAAPAYKYFLKAKFRDALKDID